MGASTEGCERSKMIQGVHKTTTYIGIQLHQKWQEVASHKVLRVRIDVLTVKRRYLREGVVLRGRGAQRQGDRALGRRRQRRRYLDALEARDTLLEVGGDILEDCFDL